MENVYFIAVGTILFQFGKFYGHLVDFVLIWYVCFSCFGMLYQEKFGNLAVERTHRGKNRGIVNERQQ
jgi:hypothetical protein